MGNLFLIKELTALVRIRREIIISLITKRSRMMDRLVTLEMEITTRMLLMVNKS